MKLSSLLPKFHKTSKPQPKKEPALRPIEAQQLVVVQPKPSVPPPNPIELLDSIDKFLRRHLVCDDHQYTLLALWIVHTWCFRSFPTAAYLHIHSVTPQSGKSLCLKLLAALCDSPLLATGAHWRAIMQNFLTPDRRLVPNKSLDLSPPHTMLLDECHHTFTSSERHRLVSMLNAGSQADCIYLDGLKHYCLFGPKAFAGNVRLPRSLASRCIPILLRHKKPSDSIVRFTPNAAASAAQLVRSLESWALANSSALAKIAHQAPDRLPPGLNARQQDCAELLLHLAHRIGGPWPAKATEALLAAFKLSERTRSLQLLGDMRCIFYLKEDPTYVSTHQLLEALIGNPNRPWSAWKNDPAAGRRIATLLRPFEIFSHDFKDSKAAHFRGYLRESFLDAWERYLPPIPPDWPQVRAAMKKEAAR